MARDRRCSQMARRMRGNGSEACDMGLVAGAAARSFFHLRMLWSSLFVVCIRIVNKHGLTRIHRGMSIWDIGFRADSMGKASCNCKEAVGTGDGMRTG